MIPTQDEVYQQLRQVIDPELGINIVDLGLIYQVNVLKKQTPEGEQPLLHILMTLTTPGCPLAGIFDQMVKDQLNIWPEIDRDENIIVELTFDPPWVPDMMSAEARAELGFD